jgi:polar amino acid transport system substrate-binding protein
MQKPTKVAIAVIAGIAVALGGGYIGAGFRHNTTTSTAQGSWIDNVKKRGELRVGIAVSPPMTVEEHGVLGGPNIIPLENLAKELGVKLTPVPASWSNIVAGLPAGKYDAAANLDRTTKRSLAISFSNAVYTYPSVFVVPSNSKFTTSKQILDAKPEIGLAQGTPQSDAMKAHGLKTLEVGDWTSAFQTLTAGRVQAVFAAWADAQSDVKSNPNHKIVIPSPAIYQGAAGYGLPADIDARSLGIINVAIESAQMNGELDRAYEEVGYQTVETISPNFIKK